MVKLNGLELYESQPGKSPVEDFLFGIQDEKVLVKVLGTLGRLDKFGYRNRGRYPKPVSGHEPLWEDRAKDIRFLFFECPNGNIVLLHAFYKKRGKIEKRHLKTARNRMCNYEERKR